MPLPQVLEEFQKQSKLKSANEDQRRLERAESVADYEGIARKLQGDIKAYLVALKDNPSVSLSRFVV